MKITNHEYRNNPYKVNQEVVDNAIEATEVIKSLEEYIDELMRGELADENTPCNED